MDGTSHRVRSRHERNGLHLAMDVRSARGRERSSKGWMELPSAESADSLFLRESLRTRLSRRREPHEPYSRSWFEIIAQLRYTKQGEWLPRILEFGKHRGEVLLGLGPGLGTDWLQYAKHGAEVKACCATPQQLALMRRHFELFELQAHVLFAEPPLLPIDDESIDVVCAHGLPAGNETQAIEEIARVLRPGGKVLAVLPAHRNAHWWQNILLPWNRLFSQQMAGASFTSSAARRLFRAFTEPRIHKRHLCRSEVPAPWRGLPPSLLQGLMGRYLIVKAFKPLPVVATVSAAA